VLGTSEHDMERLATLSVARLRVRVAIDGLQCPPAGPLSVCPLAGGKVHSLGAAAASCLGIVPRAS
jgi:hypothetical protein